MGDDTKRPEIYDYLDKKFGEVYKMFSAQGSLISDMTSDFRSFSDKERPLKVCRDHIEAVTNNLERRKANRFPSAVLTIVVGIIIIGAYAYTTLVWSQISKSVDENSKCIKELTKVMGVKNDRDN